METKIAEIADGIYRLSTFVPQIAPPAGFAFNQFLVLGDEPLMFHTGPAQDVSAQPRRARPHHPAGEAALDRLRPLRGRRVRRDERMAGGRAATPRSRTARPAALVSLNDMADRAPRDPRRTAKHDRPRRRQTRPLHRHAAHAARLGRRRDVRGDQPARCCAATCSPSSATTRRSFMAATLSARRSRPRISFQVFRAQSGHGHRPSAGWRRLTPKHAGADARAVSSQVTAPPPSTLWPRITSGARRIAVTRLLEAQVKAA